jgi:hypothetical protein
MKLIYFDEAKNDAKHPHYHIGAVCVEENGLHAVEKAINAIAVDAFGTAELGPGTELHAAEIYHRTKTFKSWNDFDRRVALLDRLIDVLNMEEVQLIDVQVDKDRLYGSYDDADVGDIAFMLLCEKADDLMREEKALGMLIGDRESDRVAARLARSLSAYRSKGTQFAYGRDIKHLVDSVHFTHSHLSRFLQLADIYTWLLQFQRRNRGSKDLRHQAVFTCLKKEGVDLFPNRWKVFPGGA